MTIPEIRHSYAFFTDAVKKPAIVVAFVNRGVTHMKMTLFAAVAAAALALAGIAAAIVNGGPDGTGHPSVGALLAPQAFPDGTWEECTGTLISPTVFLTAEHCDEGLATSR
jgi:hypothetical protein